MIPERFRTPLFFVAILLLTATLSFADSVTYSFTGTGAAIPGISSAEPVAFQLTVPDFLNPPTDGPGIDFSCAQLDSSTNCGFGVTFSVQSALGGLSAVVEFSAINEVPYFFNFSTGAFVTPGVYDSGGNDNTGTLTVSGASAVPEPTTLSLMGMGLFGAAGFVRRRLRA